MLMAVCRLNIKLSIAEVVFKEARKSGRKRKSMDKNSSNKTLFFAICVVVNSFNFV